MEVSLQLESREVAWILLTQVNPTRKWLGQGTLCFCDLAPSYWSIHLRAGPQRGCNSIERVYTVCNWSAVVQLYK